MTVAAAARRLGARAATLHDVAARAGVSPKTVSRVANREPAVRAETRLRVQQAIDALGFRPDQGARSLRSAHAHALGLVYDNPNAHFVIGLQTGVLAACKANDFGLQIHPCSASSPTLVAELLATAQRSRLAGLVLSPPMSERPTLVAALRRAGIAVVRIVSGVPKQPTRPAAGCVFVDDRRAASNVTAHLLALGHRRIGFLAGNPDHRSTDERLAGYADALAAASLRFDARMVVPGQYAFDSGFNGATGLLRLADGPTAIIGCNDEIAAGALAAVRASGRDVPGDVSVAGFEDSPFSRQAWPPLTTARQSTETIGHRATLLLLRLIGGTASSDATADSVVFVPELVCRASTAPARGH